MHTMRSSTVLLLAVLLTGCATYPVYKSDIDTANNLCYKYIGVESIYAAKRQLTIRCRKMKATLYLTKDKR